MANEDTADMKGVSFDVSEKEACVKNLKTTFTAEALNRELDEVVKDFAAYARVPGFRPGKAPAALVESNYKDAVSEEIVRRCVIRVFDKISADDSLDMLSYTMPERGSLNVQRDSGLEFEMELNVAPEIELPEYKGLKLERPEADVTKKEVEEQIDSYREMYAEFATVKSKAEEGDMLKISYSSDMELDEDLPATLRTLASAEDTWTWLSEPESLPGVIEALKGAETDGEYELQSVFPQDYREPEMAGKTVNYKIKVHEIQRRAPVKSDEALCEMLKVEDMEQLRNRIETSRKNRKAQEAEAEFRNSVIDGICDKAGDIPLPPALLGQASRREFQALANSMVNSEDDAKKFSENQEEHLKTAEKNAAERTKRFLVLRKIAREEGIEIQDSEVDKRIQMMSRVYGYKEKELKQKMESSGRIEELHMDIIMGKVSDFIIENAEIKTAAPAKKKSSGEKAPDKNKKSSEKK